MRAMMTGVANKFKGGVASGPTIFSANTATLNGSTQYFTAADNTISGLTDFSVSMRMMTGSDITTDQWPLAPYEAGGANRYLFKTSIGAGTISTKARNNAGTTFTGDGDLSSVTTNTWYHIVTVHDVSAKTITWYSDNIQLSTLTYTGSLDTNSDFILGARNPFGSFISLFHGDIASVRVYNGYALSTGDIDTIYNEGDALCIADEVTTNMTAAWELLNYTGFTGTEIEDRIGSNDLTNIGSTTFTGTGLNVECGA